MYLRGEVTVENAIKFTNTWSISVDFKPGPAVKDLPEWYRLSPGAIPAEEFDAIPYPPVDSIRPTNKTIKKCMPVFDALSAGYLLYAPLDIIVTHKDGLHFYEWPNERISAIEWHPNEQLQLHPASKMRYAPKWGNPWSIKTPKGYSCLFTHPLHRFDLPFTTLSGIVDTDEHVTPVQLPFMFNSLDFVGHIPAGTPICQVIPFKREEWIMEFGTQDDIKAALRQQWLLNKLDHLRYKKWIRKSKSFR